MTDILKIDYATKPIEFISHSNKMTNLERETTSHIYKSDIHDNHENDHEDDNKLLRNENFYSIKHNHKDKNNKLKESESKAFSANGNLAYISQVNSNSNIQFTSKLDPNNKTENNKKLNVNLNEREMLFNKQTNEISTKLTLDQDDYENDEAYYLSDHLQIGKKQSEQLKTKQEEDNRESKYKNNMKTTKIINQLTGSSTTTTTTTTNINPKDNQTNMYEDMNYSFFDNDDEFQSILKRMQTSSRQGSINSLKYLYKLLKFYKLDHYLNDLIDSGFSSPVSLRKLDSTDLDSLSVSPYDKKKFARLQLFIKQVMNTINKTHTNSARSKELNDEKLNNGIDSLLAKSSSLNGLNSNGIEYEREKKNSQPQKTSHTNPSTSSSSNKLTNLKPAPFSAYIKQSPYAFHSNVSEKKSKPPLVGVSKTQSSNSLNQRQAVNHVSTRNKYETYQSRAKSTEPTVRRTTSTISRANSSKSQVHTNRHQAPISSVCHPVQHSKTSGQQKPNAFFGPNFKSSSIEKHHHQQQQQQQPKSNGNQINEIRNVKLIRTNSYNYGVPQSQETNTFKRQKSFNGGFIKPTFSNQYMQSNTNEPKSTQIQTSDIYVFARKRPKLETESQFDDVVYIEKSLNLKEKKSPATTSICINEVKNAVDGTPILRKNEFTFDRTFDSFYTNQDIFCTSVLPFIDLAPENRTDFSCICFGQTGSGKTHTLFGNTQIDGLCVLTAEHLLKTNERLFCGFYEIYNGQLFDLINQSNKLVLREDSNAHLNVVGLVEVEIKNASQLRKTIEQAQSNRHIGSTSFNKASSRSHAVIQFKCPNEPTHQSAASNQNGHVIYKKQLNSLANVKSKINTGLNKKQEPLPFRVNFIDLAGSERGIDAQNNQNDNRKEGAEINQSLLALKECIRSLDQSCLHAPFRQSKLTRVIRDCFVGTGRTVVISTVSPTDDCVSCSLNTLQYANRIRQMTLRNRKKSDTLVRKLHSAIEITAEHVFQKDEQEQPALQSNGVLNDLPKGTTLKSTLFNLKSEPVKNPSISNVNTKTNNQSSRPTGTHFVTNEFVVNKSQNTADAPIHVEKLVKPISTNTSNGFSGGSAAAALASKYIASVNSEAKENQVLPSKPHTVTSSTNKYNQPTTVSINPLFHPSKINMSSTPIKTSMNLTNDEHHQTDGPSTIRNDVASTAIRVGGGEKSSEILMFENDTPIKGHRYKVMIQNSNKIAELAERYFQKSDLSVKRDSMLNEKIDSKKIKNVSDEAQLNKKNKNEDEESGVESDELNKSLNKLSELMRTKSTTSGDLLMKSQSQKEFLNNLKLKTNLISNLIRNGSSSSSSSLSLASSKTHKRPTTTAQMTSKERKDLLLKRFDSIYKSNSPAKGNNSRLANHSEYNDDTLVELRRKQRELFESKKLQVEFKNRFDSTSLSLNDCDDHDDEHLFFAPNGPNTDLSISNPSTANMNSQTQLKSYIQNLETKLVNLKREMHDTSTSNEKYLQEIKSRNECKQQPQQRATSRERRFSSDSSDSMKEIMLTEQSAQTNYTQLLLMKRRVEEKREKNLLAQHQQQHQQQQQQQQIQEQQQQFADDDYERLFIETQIEKQNKPRKANKDKNDFSPDEDNDDDDEEVGNDLKKSLHKGNLTDMFFSSIKNRQEKIERDFCIIGKCDFSPINKVEAEEAKSDKLRSNSHEPDLAKSVQFTKHHQPQLLNPIPIRLSSSSSSFDSFIIKAKQLDCNVLGTDQAATPLNDNLNSPRSINDANSSLKISNSSSKIWKMANPLRESIGQKWSSLLSENTQRQLELTDESSKQSAKVSLNFSNTHNEEESFESLKTKKLLVAHENQISDLAEACKKEMSLLNCLKDSQMNFDEYLIKMEEMLTKKVDSIKDLQNQINQLKSTNNSSNILNLNSTPQLS